MTESVDTPTEEAEVSPAPAVETPAEPAKKEPTKKDTGLPVGQIAVGGVGATVLGSAALASVVGPLGWLAAPAAAGAAGVGYVAYRRRRKRGRRGSQRRAEQSKTTTTRTRTVGGGSRLGGSGLSGARGRATTPAARSGGVGSAARPAGRSAAGGSARGGARPGGSSRRGGSAPRGGGLRGGASPRAGSPRTAPRGGTTPRGGLFGRGGSDATTSKRSARPTTSRPAGGTTTRGGSAAKNRWGGASGPTTASGGRIKRAARAARDWADDRTGRKASTAFKAARGERGLRARTRAARAAVRKAGGSGITAGLLGGVAGLFAPRRKKTPRGKHTDDTPEADYAKGGYTLGGPVPGHPGAYYADPRDTRPGYVDREGLPPEHPGYTAGHYDANVDPRTWEERVAAGDVTGFKPKTSTSTSTHAGGTTMSRMPATPISHELASSMARYEPQDAWEALRNAREWPGVIEQVGWAVRNYAQSLDNARFPFHSSVGEKLLEMYQALEGAYRVAEELEPLIRRVHAVDIARQEQRRGDESKWNI